MIKQLIAPAILLALVACGNEETVNEESHEEVVSSDTTELDSVVVEEEVEEASFGFEDYAQYDTKTKLYDSFDKENLVDRTAYYAEGTVEVPVTVLTDPQNNWVIQFNWDREDPEKLSALEAQWQPIYIEAFDNAVESKDGLKTGMTLDDLIEWNNGDHFKFAGFGWDYAGGVFELEGTRLADSKVQVELGMLDAGWESHPHLVGDIQFSTDDEKVKGAPIIVSLLTYYLP